MACTRALRAVVIAMLLSLPAACSDGDGGNDGATTGGKSDDTEYWCVCVMGASTTVDSNPDSECEAWCEDKGGIDHYEPHLLVTGTPACDAFCAKVEALGCGSCDEDFFCSVGVDSCPEAEIARLECEAETATFECNESGTGWHSSSGCATFDELCGTGGGGGE